MKSRLKFPGSPERFGIIKHRNSDRIGVKGVITPPPKNLKSPLRPHLKNYEDFPIPPIQQAASQNQKPFQSTVQYSRTTQAIKQKKEIDLQDLDNRVVKSKTSSRLSHLLRGCEGDLSIMRAVEAKLKSNN